MNNISLLHRLSSLNDIDFKEYKHRKYTSSPEDWRDIVIYQLLNDRFNNPDSQPNNLPWNKEESNFQGGNFRGIEEKLDYLKDLGIKAIWFSPVQQNCLYLNNVPHGYGIQDFLKIDPRFCLNTNDPEGELKNLIDTIHGKEMYVIFDIVLNHGGNVFEYEGIGAGANWSEQKYPILWRDQNGKGTWSSPPISKNDLHPAAGVGPQELFINEAWRRQGQTDRTEEKGDFYDLKEMATEYYSMDNLGNTYSVENILIDVYKYLIAEFDVDGYRIDTLKYINRDFSRLFGNAIREFALSIGKKNFFTYGEVWDNEDKIASFVGRYTKEKSEMVGVDSATDFNLRSVLVPVTKGFSAPIELVNFYEYRKSIQKEVLSTHGEASRYFVTFIDNHDLHERYLYSDEYQDQLTLALTCQFMLQGIPCLYYGTEQGLTGRGTRPESVREALWGKANAFDEESPLYKKISSLTEIRESYPELRYGRQYFREISGNGRDFGHSIYKPGIIAFSRLLSDKEAVIIANCDSNNNFKGMVLIDNSINQTDDIFNIEYSNKSAKSNTIMTREIRTANINGGVSKIMALEIDLEPLEVQILIKQ